MSLGGPGIRRRMGGRGCCTPPRAKTAFFELRAKLQMPGCRDVGMSGCRDVGMSGCRGRGSPGSPGESSVHDSGPGVRMSGCRVSGGCPAGARLCPVVSGCVRVSGGILPCPLGVQGSGVGCHQKNAIGVAHSHHPRSRFALQTSPARTRRGCCGRCGRCGRRGPQSRATQHSKTQKQSRGKMHHSALSNPKVRTNKQQNNGKTKKGASRHPPHPPTHPLTHQPATDPPTDHPTKRPQPTNQPRPK